MADYFDHKKDEAERMILIVDDDDDLRSVLAQAVEKAGFQVLSASNGLEAKKIVEHKRVDVVLSDIRMPEMDGVTLTEFVKSTTEIPVILMTGFSDILETRDAFNLGADEFLAKPFEQEEVLDAIRRCISRSEPVRVQNDDESAYCRLAIEDFVSGRQIKFNVFIRLSERKYVKVAHRGEDLSIERIRAYRAKNVDYLYLRNEDFRQYVGFGVSLAKAMRQSKGVSQEKKMNLLKHTGEVLLEQIRHEGVDQETFDQAVSFVESTVSVLSEEKEINGLLTLLNRHADYVYAHSVGVSLYGVMLARAVGWMLPTNLFKVAVGGLLHDIGEKEIDRAQIMKPRGQWAQEELKAYETHSVRGAEILGEVRYISTDIIVIITQHHENCLGMGFPSRLKKSAIHPMAKLIAVADEFCSRIVRTPSSPGMSPSEALTQMNAVCSDRLEPSFFSALMRLCKFTPPSKGVANGRPTAD